MRLNEYLNFFVSFRKFQISVHSVIISTINITHLNLNSHGHAHEKNYLQFHVNP